MIHEGMVEGSTMIDSASDFEAKLASSFISDDIPSLPRAFAQSDDNDDDEYYD